MTEINDLIDALKKASGLDVTFGPKDLAPDSYPSILLYQQDDGEFLAQTIRGMSYTIPLTIEIHNDRNREMDSYVIMEKIFKSLNLHKAETGSNLGTSFGNIEKPAGTYSAEYDENTFTINIPYSISKTINNDQ